MNIKELLADWGINAIALVAAMIGGLLHVVMDENEFSYKSACAQILSATAFGGYGTEWLIKWLGWEEKVSVIGLMGLCLGLCGLMVAKGIYKLGKKFESSPIGFLTKNKNNDTGN